MKIDKRLIVVAVLLNLAVCLTGGRVLALTIEVDEFGNGIGTLGSAITNDPGQIIGLRNRADSWP